MTPPAARPDRAAVLTFLGGTGTVTGSKFLVDSGRSRILVDCGLFQGLKDLRQRNWGPFPVDPATIDAVVVTHAHVDHLGYLPALARGGFTGPVVATAGTTELAEIVLPDCAHVQEEDAQYANGRGFSKHHPAEPLYTRSDARRVLAQFRRVPFERCERVAPGVSATFHIAGHILGSASVAIALESSGRRLLFSGDLGRPTHPILKSPTAPGAADVVVVESTYGNRRHEDEHSRQSFRDAIVRTADRGGTVVIPAFAVDRTEVILLELRRLTQAGQIPELPVYADSPMALASLDVYRRAIAAGSADIRSDLSHGPDPFDPGRLIESRTVEQSIAINSQRFPSIIISASGMAAGGRVLHHLRQRLPDPKNTVLLVGFQAEGTRGRALAEGARQIKLLGRYVPVRAEIMDVPAFSIHADAEEAISWLRRAPSPPEMTFVVHGEPDASTALCHDVADRLGWNAVVPHLGERVRLD